MAPTTMNAPKVKYFNIHYPAEYVAHVEINRPEKLNAFSDGMFIELKHIFEYLSRLSEVRAILVSGAGDRAFTAGLDVSQAGSDDGVLTRADFADASRRANFLRRYIEDIQTTVSAVANCEKATICLLHGVAFGMAIDFSTACDIRLCSADAKLCVKEVDVGLAADVGTLSRLPKAVGLSSWAKEVCLSARVFGADEAFHNNFVSRVLPDKAALYEEGLRVAKLIASKSPVAVVGTKAILDQAWGRTVEENLHYTAVWNSAMLQSKDTSLAMKGALQKRTPTFEKL